ncbi:MAG: 1-deoxy-D-xylulose-5-phosphate reductoisomerase [Armatimonadota bacterium]|nr:1-deoxy-D-xylulose-5-phosphate reductoisomerase [Armatimonadota bacterium]MDR5697742.1 1-deoxy-D-xylulose-5-phosphate reductoisomerase [Armatimonadota bacterium]
MKRLAILGSTGSIGQQALQVADALADRVRVVALAARRDVDTLAEQIRRWRPEAVAVWEPAAAAALADRVAGWRGELFAGPPGLERVAGWPSANVVLVCVVGIAGLVPTLAAIAAGKDVALANKEALVAGGPLVRRAVAEHGVRLIPVDGEHSAIYQCLRAGHRDQVARIVITASGGPFLRRSLEGMECVTPQEALAHPTWRMGPKITVDSATLMNKALEVIEARWLFDLPPSRIQVVIHPQSIVHGMVEFADGSVVAHLSPPDMRLFIQYALTDPDRTPPAHTPMDWTVHHTLTFEPPDLRRFPSLSYAYEALAVGGTMPAVLNAANEAAVHRFLAGELGFAHIPRAVRAAMELHETVADPNLEDILEADRWARAVVRSL